MDYKKKYLKYKNKYLQLKNQRGGANDLLIGKLINDTTSKITQFLNFEDFYNLASTSKEYYDYLLVNPDIKIDIKDLVINSPTTVNQLLRVGINLDNGTTTGKRLIVENLTIEITINNEILADILSKCDLTFLETLIVNDCNQITNAGFVHLSNLKDLKRIDFDKSNWIFSITNSITNSGLKHLSKLINLQTLNLSWCNLITSAGLKYLSNLTNLQTLNLSWCNKITDSGLEYLYNLTNLQTLNLNNCRLITDLGLDHLSNLINLQRLDVSECNLITNVGLAHLYNLRNLQRLNLRFTAITDAGVENISNILPALEVLYGNELLRSTHYY